MKSKNGMIVTHKSGDRGRVNYDQLDATTETDIERQAVEDGEDLVAWTPEQRRRAKFVRPRKVSIAIRLDPEVLEKLKAEGPRYQSRINAILRAYFHL
jgi:uncharacterized protein (DUF4415 family)